jgi:polysaccharide pyruvyl transferase WcaK-like protein
MAPILARYRLQPGRYLAFTTRPWFYAERRRGDETRYRSYVANAAALLDWSLEAGHVDRVALVVQNDGAHSANEPDLPVLHDIQARMRQADRAVLMADDFTSQELCGVYRTALAVLGTRLHSCIFASVVGTPPVAIAYSHKAQGIMGMLNLADHVLDIHDLSVERGQAILGKIAAERDELAAQMTPRVAQLRRDLEQAVLQALAGGQADAGRRA